MKKEPPSAKKAVFALGSHLFVPLTAQRYIYYPEIDDDRQGGVQVRTMKIMIAICGLDCEKGDAYIAAKNDDQALREKKRALKSALSGSTIRRRKRTLKDEAHSQHIIRPQISRGRLPSAL